MHAVTQGIDKSSTDAELQPARRAGAVPWPRQRAAAGWGSGQGGTKGLVTAAETEQGPADGEGKGQRQKTTGWGVWDRRVCDRPAAPRLLSLL